jgi:hypothetical protein
MTKSRLILKTKITASLFGQSEGWSGSASVLTGGDGCQGQSLNSRIKVELRGIKKNFDIIYTVVDQNAGLEFVGNVQELIKGFRDRSQF